MACTPIGVSPPQGVSSLSARQASGFRNSAFGKVIVASKCRSVPSVPGLDLLAQFGHLRMEAPVVAEAERDPGLCGGGDRRFGIGLVQGEGLLAEDVLADLRGGDRLRRVQRVRRRQHHRIDVRVRQQRVVAESTSRELLRLAERLHLRRHRARRARDEADLVAVGDGFHEGSPPPSHADDCGSESFQLPLPDPITTHRGGEAPRPRSLITNRGGAETRRPRVAARRAAGSREVAAQASTARACARGSCDPRALGRRHRGVRPQCLSASVCRSHRSASPRLRGS